MQFRGAHTHTGFLDLLCDAAFQLRLSQQSADSYSANRHARASIVAAALSIECCANCLVSSLTMPARLEEDVESMKPISKFDLYLRFSAPDKSLDRGDTRLAKIVELIKLRNEFVHPKVTDMPADFGLLVEKTDVTEWPMEFTSPIFQNIGIPKISMFWSPTNAESALSAVLAFYAYFFEDLLDANDEIIKNILMQRTQVQLGDTSVRLESIFVEFEAELKWAASQGFNLRFLGFPSKLQ